MNQSEYLGVWNVVMFDLPVGTTRQKRAYAQFRKLLLRMGYSRLQFSVYARFYGSEKQSEPHGAEIIGTIPAEGHVRILKVTDRQFAKMQNFFGESSLATEQADEQIMLF